MFFILPKHRKNQRFASILQDLGRSSRSLSSAPKMQSEEKQAAWSVYGWWWWWWWWWWRLLQDYQIVPGMSTFHIVSEIPIWCVYIYMIIWYMYVCHYVYIHIYDDIYIWWYMYDSKVWCLDLCCGLYYLYVCWDITYLFAAIHDFEDISLVWFMSFLFWFVREACVVVEYQSYCRPLRSDFNSFDVFL